MTDVAHPGTIPCRTRDSFVPALFFFSPLVTSAAPRLTWLFLTLISLALIVPLRNEWRGYIRTSTALIPLLLIVFYAFLSVSWAADRGAALEKSSLLLVTILLAYVGSRAVAGWDEARLSRAAIGFVAGAFLGALFVLTELVTHGAITRFAATLFSLLRPDSSKLGVAETANIGTADFRRNVAILVLHLWPGLLVLSAIAGRTRRAILIGLFVLAVAIPVAISERESSQLALVGSFLVFLLACQWRGGAVRVLAVLWCLGFVLVLPLVFSAFKADLHMKPWLPNSARARIILWDFTAERTLERPWLGIGAASTAALKQPNAIAEKPTGFLYPRSTGPHAHSLFLQVWYELGAVGVLLFICAGVALVMRIPMLAFESQPFAAATFAAFVGSVSVAWGIWQTWLMCGVGLMLLYLLVAARSRPAMPRMQSTSRPPGS